MVIIIIYLGEGGYATWGKEVSKNKICESQVKFTVSYKKSVVENQLVVNYKYSPILIRIGGELEFYRFLEKYADIPLMTANFLNFRNFRHKWANNGNSWHFLALLGAFLSIPFLITNPPPFQFFFIKCPPSLLITPYPPPNTLPLSPHPRPTPGSLLLEISFLGLYFIKKNVLFFEVSRMQ